MPTTGIPRLATWVRATSLGWLLGFPLIILLALGGEAIGIGGIQSLVGAAMGIGIGVMQGRVLRPALGPARPWILATTIGLALPFLVYDLSVALDRPLPYLLPVVVAIGGVCVGGWQVMLLARTFAGTGIWVVASVVGWTAAAGAAFAADLLQKSGIRGITGALLYLGAAALGGPVLGLMTGLALRRLRDRPFSHP
jgi:hypothetical protein